MGLRRQRVEKTKSPKDENTKRCVRDFRKIKAWQLADDLAVRVYEVTKGFPRSEAYGMTSQLRRAAVSVAANIVGGALQETTKDYLNFVDEAEFNEVDELSRQTFACLHGLIAAVRLS